jgi:hypothetical protein
VAIQESVEQFTVFNIGYKKQEIPATLTAAVGPRLAAFGSPESLEGSGVVALYAYYPDKKAWGFVGAVMGSHMDASDSIRGLGSSLAIVGDTVIMGAKGDANAPGRVVIAQAPYGVWTYGAVASLHHLSAPKAAKGDGFGTSVAACYDGQEWYVAVGAPNVEPPMGPYGRGAAFVYRGLSTSNTPWSANWATNPVQGAEASHNFGASVAISPNLDEEGRSDGTVTLAVGAPGAADGQGVVYVGHTTAPGEWPGRWTYAQAIEPKFPDFIDEDFRTTEFGSAVAIAAGTVLAVGSPADPNFEKEIEGTGAVWLYNRSGGEWDLVQEGGSLYGAEAEAEFGRSIAFPGLMMTDGEIPSGTANLVVGSPGNRVAAMYSSDDGSTYVEKCAFTAFAGKPGDRFGQTVAITVIPDAEPWCVVGAAGDNANQVEGGGYVFAEEEQDMKWLPAPETFTDLAMRWVGIPLEQFKKYTPEPNDYFR